MNPIIIEPLIFSWRLDWIPRTRACLPRALAAERAAAPDDRAMAMLRAVTAWQTETDAWLKALSERHHRDIVSLLFAENMMLYLTISPGHGPKPEVGGWEWSDFRQRYYEAMPLVRAIERIGLPRAEVVTREFRDLEMLAEEREWLP